MICTFAKSQRKMYENFLCFFFKKESRSNYSIYFQIGIALITNIILLPINLLIVFLFRYSREKEKVSKDPSEELDRKLTNSDKKMTMDDDNCIYSNRRFFLFYYQSVVSRQQDSSKSTDKYLYIFQ